MSAVTTSGYKEFGIVMLYWLIDQLHVELKEVLNQADAHLKVIRVTHHFPDNTYPALGLVFDTSFDEYELETLIQETTTRLVQNTPVIELIRFHKNSNIDWKKALEDIMGD